jgi:putative peptidoglycan lipid II flippase
MVAVTATVSSGARPRIMQAATIVMAFFIASRVLGVVRDIVISHQFGTSRALDAYFAAFKIPDLIFNVVAGGALGSAFIPTFAAALAVGDTRRAWQLASAILNLVFILLTAISAVMMMLAPQVVGATVARGFAPADQELTASLMRWMLLTPIVFGLSGILMGILNSYQHFVLPALAPVIYNAAIIAGAVLLAPVMGVYGLVAGVVAGAFLHLLIQVPWLLHHRVKYTPTLGLGNPDVVEVGRLMLPRTLGLAVVQINLLVNTILASGLPAGRIAALSYAFSLMLLPHGIVALSLATAVFPTFSEQMARQDLDEFRATFSQVLRATLYLTIPATVGLFVLGTPLIALLFQRGEFDARSTAETAFALQFYAIGLFAHSSLEIITRAFYAMHDTRTPVTVGVIAMTMNLVLSLLLITPLAQGGLALANSIATILEMGVLLGILRQRLGGLDDRRFLASVIRIFVAAVVMGLTLSAYVPLAAGHGVVVTAGVGIVLGAIVYFAATAGLGSEEISAVLRRRR